jgi:hypothetical protein
MSCCHGIGATEASKSIRQPEYLSDRYAVFTGFQLPITLTTRADPLIGEILNRKNHL